MTTGYKYEEDDEDSMNYINEILEQIMPDDGDRKYLLSSISLCLINDNPLGEVYYWYRTGHNGRGLIRDMIMHTMGDYFGILPYSYIRRSSKSLLDPSLEHAANRRIVYANGPDKKIKTFGFVKRNIRAD